MAEWQTEKTLIRCCILLCLSGWTDFVQTYLSKNIGKFSAIETALFFFQISVCNLLSMDATCLEVGHSLDSTILQTLVKQLNVIAIGKIYILLTVLILTSLISILSQCFP